MSIWRRRTQRSGMVQKPGDRRVCEREVIAAWFPFNGSAGDPLYHGLNLERISHSPSVFLVYLRAGGGARCRGRLSFICKFPPALPSPVPPPAVKRLQLPPVTDMGPTVA